MPLYTPPGHGAANIELAPLYAPPAHNAANIELNEILVPTQTIVCVGFDSLSIGPTTIGFAPSYTRPYGLDMLEVGDHLVAYRNRELLVVGTEHLRIGDPTIFNLQTTIQPPGFSDEALGQPHVKLQRQYIGVVPGPDMSAFGLHELHSTIGPTQIVRPTGFDLLSLGATEVSFALRYIIFLATQEMTQWGTASVYPRVRQIFPLGDSATQFGLAQFGWVPEIKPYPIDSVGFGTPNVNLGNVRHMQGWDSLEMGEVTLRSTRSIIKVAEWDEKDKFGSLLIYNRKQILYVDNKQYFDFERVGAYTEVALRNRHVFPESWSSSHVPFFHRLRLTGQQVLPAGIDSTQWGDHMVAFKIRHIYPDTRYFFAGYIDPYHFVHNQATRIYPVGIDSAKFGLQRVWFNAQYIAPRYIVQDKYGTPFVADRVRYVQQFDSDLGGIFGTPWISNRVRTIVQPPYIVPYSFGTPILYTHKNVITTFPIAYNAYGTPHVHNVTPQLYPSMADQAEIGRPWVSHTPRTLYPVGIGEAALGEPLVIFRDRTVFPAAISQMAVPWPTVRQQYEVQLFDQTIWPPSFGNVYDYDGIGNPSIRRNPYPEGWDSQQFGTAQARSMGIKPYWPLPDSFYGFGIPTINSQQWVVQVNEDGEEGAQTRWPTLFHRVSPHTIWCRHDTPQQAIDNNPQSPYPWFDMDTGPRGTEPPPPWFGTATISTPGLQVVVEDHTSGQDQTVGGWVGDASVNNTKHVIYPVGFNAVRFGMATLPGPRKIWTLPFPEELTEFGQHIVGTPSGSVQYIGPSSIDSLAFSPQHIEDKNRNIYVAGFVATFFGDNNPLIYHYPRGPTVVGGADSSVFGDETWVSFKNRLFSVEGWDSFTEGYTRGKFEDRMRVSSGVPPNTYSVGDTARLGIPVVSSGQGATQWIGPYMIPPPELCHPHDVELVEA